MEEGGLLGGWEVIGWEDWESGLFDCLSGRDAHTPVLLRLKGGVGKIEEGVFSGWVEVERRGGWDGIGRIEVGWESGLFDCLSGRDAHTLYCYVFKGGGGKIEEGVFSRWVEVERWGGWMVGR